MSESVDSESVGGVDVGSQQVAVDADLDPVELKERLFQLWWSWADFQLYIVTPTVKTIVPPVAIKPAHLSDDNHLEFVYTIYDHGNMFATSKAEDMFNCSQSMCKLYYTIEKMVFLLMERLQENGSTGETEIQVAFGGHQNAQRKGFESVINMPFNIVVTNFDPGVWGDRYLQIVERLAEKGYGYPSAAPRDIYKHAPVPIKPTKASL